MKSSCHKAMWLPSLLGLSRLCSVFMESLCEVTGTVIHITISFQTPQPAVNVLADIIIPVGTSSKLILLIMQKEK